ncbi:MAG: hypothetical protein JOZ47_10245 [Kutzneria sp.]|nr:hypothetical protein [Kutzneria sp.]
MNVTFIPARTAGSDSGAAPVLGLGSLERLDGGVRLRAHRTRATTAAVLGAAVGVAGALLAAVALTGLEAAVPVLASYPKKVGLIAGIGCGVLPGLLAYRLLRHRIRGPRVDVLVPWSAIRVLAEGTGRAVFRLAAFELRGDVTAIALDPESARALAVLSWECRSRDPASA